MRPSDGERALLSLQVTTRSPLGAIAYSTGGLLIDHGWIRALGGGSTKLPRDIATWNDGNGAGKPPRLPGAVLVADDVLGGFFALNGSAFEGGVQHVFYFAPDSLKWEDTGRSYSEFLTFLFDGDLAKFYEGQRWPSWKKDVEALSGDRAYSFQPFPFTKDGGPLERRSRRDVPIHELWGLYTETLAKQLGGLADGEKVDIEVTP